MSVLRRVRAYGGHFLLLAVLTLVTALLVTGMPRIADRLSGQGLREQLADVPGPRRDLLYTRPAEPQPAPGVAAAQRAALDSLLGQLPAPVREMVGERWYVADTEFGRLTGPELTADKGLIDLSLRTMTGLRESATLVDGRWPGEGADRAAPVETVLAEPVARQLGLRPGSRLHLALHMPDGQEYAATTVAVVGLFRPVDADGGAWDALPSALRLTPPVGDGQPFQMVGLTDEAGFDDRAAAGWAVGFGWRYRIDPGRLTPGRLDALVDGLSQADRERPAGLLLAQGVDIPLRQYADSLAAARTLLTVIAAGVLATLAGLTVLRRPAGGAPPPRRVPAAARPGRLHHRRGPARPGRIAAGGAGRRGGGVAARWPAPRRPAGRRHARRGEPADLGRGGAGHAGAPDGGADRP
ncbi:hypothetical protein JNW89_35495, partial [Micromonospora sp. 4G55]|nr:hypothetical protein [Micromonospora sp. 4G55]